MTGSADVQVVGNLTSSQFESALRGEGLGVRLGCFTPKIRADVPALAEPLFKLYRDYPLVGDDTVFSFHVQLLRVGRLFGPPRVRLIVDGRIPHEDMPEYQALAVLEWGMNLVIALRMHAFLMLHSAAVERNGGLLLLPAAPGHGKTTLCAALAHRGWRLFSDEFGLLRCGESGWLPLPRPMPLKNESIDVIRAFAPSAELGPAIPKTRKGTVVHVKAPRESIRAADRRAECRWIVFPRWSAGSRLSIERIPKSEAFAQLATNAFNYELLGEVAFVALRDAIDASDCFRLEYSNLEEAVAELTRLADDKLDA